jgi:hypothetical protein
MNDRRLDRAVAPNLFDAAADPDVVFPLVLANLMSPRLWELRDRLSGSGEPARVLCDGTIRPIQQFVDHHFEHVTPDLVAEMNGVLDLDAEAERLGSAAVEHTLSMLQSTFAWRIARGAPQKDAFALDLISRRKFPSYIYATIDEAWASRRLLQRRKHKPLGLTCCLDEAAIFVALVLTLPGGSVDDFAFIGAPTHYSVLLWSGEETWWYYSKHELYSAPGWARVVAEVHAGDAQAAFDDRLRDFDRIITASGTHAFEAGETSIDRARLAEIVRKIDAFFGVRLSQLDRAGELPAPPAPPSNVAGTTRDLSSACGGAEEVRARLRSAALDAGDPAALRALYCFRTLDLPDLRVYLQAARRGARIVDLSATIATIDDAVRSVAAIAGSESMFEDPDRIAMPDETARLGTGTARDKALLLHVLLERVLAIDDPARTSLETLFTDAGSFVRSARFCISMSRMASVPEIEGRVLYRIAEA